MAKRHGREALRGVEVQVLDLISQVLTADQWAELLKGPLERAADRGNGGLAQKLIAAGARIGDALQAAVRGGHGEAVNVLLEGGASFETKSTKYGRTPLHIAAEEGKPEMVQLLMRKGADKDALDGNEWTPLYTSAYYGSEAATVALLAGGADVNLESGHGKTSVIHIAAEDTHVDILRAVIEHGADVDAADGTYQNTALHLAAQSNRAEAIDVLVEAGAEIEARDSGGGTPLHSAATHLSLEALSALLKHGAQANAQDDDLETPLHVAVTNGGIHGAAEAVELLLRSGADETILNKNGKTAADILGAGVEEEDRLAENVELVYKLLANAPADKAWRRRGYLALCRAHPDRLHRAQESGTAHSGAGRTTLSCAKLARAETSRSYERVAGGTRGGRSSGEWAVVMARVLRLEEEGVFRNIVGFI